MCVCVCVCYIKKLLRIKMSDQKSLKPIQGFNISNGTLKITPYFRSSCVKGKIGERSVRDLPLQRTQKGKQTNKNERSKNRGNIIA